MVSEEFLKDIKYIYIINIWVCIFLGRPTSSKAGKFDFGETDPGNITPLTPEIYYIYLTIYLSMIEYTTIEPWVGGYELKIYHEYHSLSYIFYAHKRSRHQRMPQLWPPLLPQELSRSASA